MIKKIKKCYIYTRVSTAIQVDGYSLDAQKDKLRKYAEYQDYTIAGEYSDEGFSGKILSGLLRCSDCGKPLYGNIAKAHSKDNKTRYYYYCKNTRGETGHRCSFRTNLEQTEIDRYVAAIISAMVHDKQFEEAIQKKIRTAVNTDDLEKELDVVKSRLHQMLVTKSRLETHMDTMDVSEPHYERKILDLQRRYDDLYDKIAEAEQQIEETQKQIQTIRSEQISGENVYQLLLAFDELYVEMDEPNKKELLRAIIERIRPGKSWRY